MGTKSKIAIWFEIKNRTDLFFLHSLSSSSITMPKAQHTIRKMNLKKSIARYNLTNDAKQTQPESSWYMGINTVSQILEIVVNKLRCMLAAPWTFWSLPRVYQLANIAAEISLSTMHSKIWKEHGRIQKNCCNMETQQYGTYLSSLNKCSMDISDMVIDSNWTKLKIEMLDSVKLTLLPLFVVKKSKNSVNFDLKVHNHCQMFNHSWKTLQSDRMKLFQKDQVEQQ